MEWYYAEDGQRFGPYSPEQMTEMVEAGKITAVTLVWRQGMENWQAFQTVSHELGGGTTATATLAPGASLAFCSQCNRSFATDEMITYQGQWICAQCKPLFFQKVREGEDIDRMFGRQRYAGFWIRLVAKLVDGLVLGTVCFGLVFGLLFSVYSSHDPHDLTRNSQSFILLIYALIIAITIAYDTLFVGKYGATLGKMACGLRVVNSNGQKTTYLRAFARRLSEWLTYMIPLYIGYIMAAFSKQKCALHDHICSTRVVHK